MQLKVTTATALFVLLTAALNWQSCKKDEPKDPECKFPNATLSYSQNMKAIIDQYCISCHSPGSGVAGVVGDFTTYDGIKSRLADGAVLDRVVVKKDMPQGGGMSQGLRDSINCWIAAGFPN